MRVKFKVASQFHHLLKIKTCCDAAIRPLGGQSGVEMTEILVRLGSDLFVEAEVLFDGGEAIRNRERTPWS
jgi:prefoldin subunit 5